MSILLSLPNIRVWGQTWVKHFGQKYTKTSNFEHFLLLKFATTHKKPPTINIVIY